MPALKELILTQPKQSKGSREKSEIPTAEWWFKCTRQVKQNPLLLRHVIQHIHMAYKKSLRRHTFFLPLYLCLLQLTSFLEPWGEIVLEYRYHCEKKREIRNVLMRWIVACLLCVIIWLWGSQFYIYKKLCELGFCRFLFLAHTHTHYNIIYIIFIANLHKCWIYGFNKMVVGILGQWLIIMELLTRLEKGSI